MTTSSDPYNESTAAWEPVAEALRASGLDAWADDGGHANYGVFVKIGTPRVESMFVGAADGSFGYDLTDPEGYSLGGDALSALQADADPASLAAAIAGAVNALRAEPDPA